MNPFVGLRPFRQDERAFFMGRERAAAYVETKAVLNPLTLLFARSGIGKSSFLTSRLIPELQEQSSVVYINEWGSRRPESLVGDSLSAFADNHSSDKSRGFLILDQFEDVFKQYSDRRELWDCLAEVLHSDHRSVNMIVAMREEWLGAWEEVEQYVPDAYGSLVRLAPLTYKELIRAIVKPIEIEGSVAVEKDVSDTLIADLKQESVFGLVGDLVEPGLLQLVCQRVWQEAYDRNICFDKDLYQRLGGASTILQEFVWRRLGETGSEAVFSPDQRLLWAGLTRHLAVTRGVKAIVTAENLGKKLLLADLGIAGPAVSAGKSMSVRAYLSKPIERRKVSNAGLDRWITDTLERAHKFGFLKRQEAMIERGDGTKTHLYELAHDRFDEMFREFSLEYEKWITKRVYIFLSAIFVLLVLAPFFAYGILSIGLAQVLLLIPDILLGAAFYIFLVWLVLLITPYFAAVLYYPFVRLFVRGRVVSKKNRQRGALPPTI